MSQDSDDYRQLLERQQELIKEQEAFRLQQEERRLRTARQRERFTWVRNTVLLLVSTLQMLLVIRFVLQLTKANPDNVFARLIYNLSDPFVAPFATLFVSPTNATATRVFDLNTLVALIVYALLGSLAIAALNYLQGQEPY
jgi:uncharacterized protein YggT (Ycf19 family)